MITINMDVNLDKNINDLDNDCLSLLFNQFTLQQMIPLRIICKRWQTVINLMCHRKTLLQLFTTDEDRGTYQRFATRYCDSVNNFALRGNQLIIPSQSTDLCLFLPALFPNVEKLIYRCKLDVVPLLENWSQLKFLCLYMFNCKEPKEKIWNIINSMKTLKQLHLFVYDDVILEEKLVLTNLESFSLSYYFGDIVTILLKLGPTIRKLYLDYIPCNLNQLYQLIQIKPEIAVKLTHLTVVNIRSNQSSIQDRKKFLQLICKNFTSLTHLDVTFTNQIPLLELLPYLAHLINLIELKLEISRICGETNVLPVQAMIPLRSIKSLHLTFCEPYDGAQLTNFDTIPVIFPMLEVLILHSYNSELLSSLKHYNLNRFSYLTKTNITTAAVNNK